MKDTIQSNSIKRQIRFSSGFELMSIITVEQKLTQSHDSKYQITFKDVIGQSKSFKPRLN